VAAFLLGLFLGAMGMAHLAPRSLVYEGEPLGYWLDDKDLFQESVLSSRACQAIEHLGSDAIPVYLRMLRATDSRFKLWALKQLRRQPFVRVPFVPANVRRVQAGMALCILGPKAKGTAPQLAGILRSPDPQIAAAAVRPLAALGTNTLNVLVEALREGDTATGSRVVDVARRMTYECQHAQEGRARSAWFFHPAFDNGAVVLSIDHPARDAVLTLLTNALKHASPAVRTEARDLMLRVVPVGAEPTYGETVRWLNSRDPVLRAISAALLGTLDTSPTKIIPLLLSAVRDEDPRVRAAVARALGNFGDQGQALFPTLLELTKDSDAEVRQQAKVAAMRVAPADAAKAGLR